MTVGIVFVSHSAKIAEGLVDLARQMAGSVALVAAGGTDDGGLGTSFDRVSSAMMAADSGSGVVVLCDLGSAYLTAETALDFVDDDARPGMRIVDAPLVEGGVAAAVAAETGAKLEAVVAAARSAFGGEVPEQDQGMPGDAMTAGGAIAETAASATQEASASTDSRSTPEDVVRETVTIINPEGLHARPAAEFVKLASSFDAAIRINGVDAKSLLRIMTLAIMEGSEVTITATGAQATEAVDGLAALIRSGFGEA